MGGQYFGLLTAFRLTFPDFLYYNYKCGSVLLLRFLYLESYLE